MFQFILKRLGILVPTFIGITILTFVFVHLIPGDPVLILAGERGISPERHAELMAQLGLDKPLTEQYFHYLMSFFRGDLGVSFKSQLPILEEFIPRFKATMELGLCAMIFAVSFGIPIGVLAAVKRGSVFDYTAIVGESGCGKSSLARLLTMIEKPTGGELYFKGQDLLKSDKLTEKQQRKKIQIVFQNPYSSLNPRKKIGTILEEPLLINTDLSKDDRKAKVLSMMEKVGLKEEFYNRYPHMFSGGQRQRVAIARGLMLDPEIVVADEPVSALDVSVRAQVLNLMMDLQDELGLSYVFISHDLSVIEHIADEIMVMYLGRCVEQGSKNMIYDNPQHPYTQALLSATPRLNPELRRDRIKLEGELPSPLNPPEGCAFNARCRFAFDRCRKEQPNLIDYAQHAISCFHVESQHN